MIRGTTPTFQLLIDESVDLTQTDHVYATFKQDCFMLTKTGEDIEVSEHQVDVYFSQEESLKFRKGAMDVQLNWTFQNGKRACTNIVSVKIGENLINGVLQ